MGRKSKNLTQQPKSTNENKSDHTLNQKQQYSPTERKHGSENITILIIFSCFILCLIISYDIGYTRSEIYHDPLVSVTMTLEEHFYQLRNNWKSLRKTFPDFILFEPKRPGESLRDGELIKDLKVKAKHPVVLVPGVVTSKVCLITFFLNEVKIIYLETNY